MNLGFSPSGNNKKDLILKLKLFAREIEHKFQQRRAHDIDPIFLDQILALLQRLVIATKDHEIQNKIGKIENTIIASTRYYKDNKYEDFYERVKMLIDKLDDLSDE